MESGLFRFYILVQLDIYSRQDMIFLSPLTVHSDDDGLLGVVNVIKIMIVTS